MTTECRERKEASKLLFNKTQVRSFGSGFLYPICHESLGKRSQGNPIRRVRDDSWLLGLIRAYWDDLAALPYALMADMRDAIWALTRLFVQCYTLLFCLFLGSCFITIKSNKYIFSQGSLNSPVSGR